MDYLDFLGDEPLAQRNEWHPIYDMVKGEHRVGRFLKKRGYHFIQIGSWWSLTQDNTLADESYSFGLSEFSLICLRKTMFPRLLQAALPRSGLASMMAWDHGQCRRVPLQARMVTGDRAAPRGDLHLRPCARPARPVCLRCRRQLPQAR